MFAIPLTRNSIYISTVQTGCCKAEFDSTYPVHLNGIIGQQEFQESIYNINQTISNGRKHIWPMLAIFFGSMIITMGCFIGGAMLITSSSSDFSPLFSVGIALSMISSIIFIITMVIIRVRYTTQLRKVIAEESRKYSTRSPTPCSWRLETGAYFGGYGNNNANAFYHLIIDIGHSSAPASGPFYSNQDTSNATYFTGQQNQYFSSPPPYSGTSLTVCSRCGANGADFSARFCSSCGQAFNK